MSSTATQIKWRAHRGSLTVILGNDGLYGPLVDDQGAQGVVAAVELLQVQQSLGAQLRDPVAPHVESRQSSQLR